MAPQLPQKCSAQAGKLNEPIGGENGFQENQQAVENAEKAVQDQKFLLLRKN
jgi:hypothetical protein